MSPSRYVFLGKEMATHSSILAWRIPWKKRSLAGYSPRDRKDMDTTGHLSRYVFTFIHLYSLGISELSDKFVIF